MNKADQILEIAKLDEPHQRWEHILDPDGKTWVVGYRYPAHRGYIAAKDYLHFYDAIIPVIQKQPNHWLRIEEMLMNIDKGFEITPVFCATPSQLCEALLRVTGKWIE